MQSWIQRVLNSVTVAFGDAAAYSVTFDVGRFHTLLLTLAATVAFTGGSSPGVKFTLQVDTTGTGNWVAASTLIATGNGFAANAVADATITATGTSYRYYPVTAGVLGRIKYEVTGTPTGGSSVVTVDVHQKSGD